MKKYIKYLIIFFIFLYCLLIPYNMFMGDSITNFGFTYALRMGEIPYRDFNMVVPIFSTFIYSLPLFIYNSFITFYITQAVFLTVLFIILEKELKEKIYLFFLIICFSFPIILFSGLFPGYNFLVFLLLVIIVYLEKNNKNDLLVGILIGLSILTKHTIGVFYIIPTFIYYYKDIKRIFKRLIGLCIPLFIFLIYLLVTNSLKYFIDLGILGLFDFMSSNSSISSVLLIIVLIICLIYYAYNWIKDKDIEYLYGICTLLFMIPIIEMYHASYFLYVVLYLFIKKNNFSKFRVPSIILIFILISIWSFITFNYNDYKYINYNNYPMRYSSKNMVKNYKYITYVSNKYKNVNLFLIGTENHFYKITNNQKITYFDLPNYGNYGYDSYNKMVKMISEKHNSYFLVSITALKDKNPNQQYYKELVKYIIKNGKFIEKNEDYSLYYFE